MEGYHLLCCHDFAVAYCNCNIATSGTNATATSTTTALLRTTALLHLITLATPGDETHQPQAREQHRVGFGLGY